MENVVGVDVTNHLAADLDFVIEEMGDLWKELRGARIFLTGGTGFFGCWLLETLVWANERLELGASAVVLTRSPGAFAAKAPHLAGHRAVTLCAGDVRTFDPVPGAFTHVIHAASDGAPIRHPQDRLRTFDTIVTGTRRALEFAAASGAARFLLTSSGAVYGRQPADVAHVPEDYPGGPDPADAGQLYGEAKRAAEMLCALYATDCFQPVIARCFAFVGPYLPLDASFAAGNFIRDALGDDPIRIAGDGTPYRSYLYAADLAIWLWTILLRGQSGRPYNVGSPHALTIRDLADAVVRAAGSTIGVEVARRPIPDAAPLRYVPLTDRAERELGLRVVTTVDDALARTLEWHRRRRFA